MATAEEVVTDAYGLLAVLDINETAPSPVEMSKAIRALNSMIDAWAGQGLNVVDQALSAETISGDTAVVLDSTARLAPGMNVSGTGIAPATRILTIDNSQQITLDTAATASGTATLTFALLPIQPRFEEGVAALLALRLAPRVGEDNIPAIVVELARDGWAALQGNYMVVPSASFDAALVNTTGARRGSQVLLG